jgi:hypothetical protein
MSSNSNGEGQFALVRLSISVILSDQRRSRGLSILALLNESEEESNPRNSSITRSPSHVEALQNPGLLELPSRPTAASELSEIEDITANVGQSTAVKKGVERAIYNWSPEELTRLDNLRGQGKGYEEISRHMPRRTSRACRQKYNSRHGITGTNWVKWTQEQDARLIELVRAKIGWEDVAEQLPGPKRTAGAYAAHYVDLIKGKIGTNV